SAMPAPARLRSLTWSPPVFVVDRILRRPPPCYPAGGEAGGPERGPRMAKRQRAGKTPPTARKREWPLFRSLAGYRLQFLTGDLVAGLTLAAIAIPGQMATARLGNFPPQVGLIVLVAAALAFALFGGSRFLSCGADSTITPIFYGGLTAGGGARRGPPFLLAPPPPPPAPPPPLPAPPLPPPPL